MSEEVVIVEYGGRTRRIKGRYLEILINLKTGDETYQQAFERLAIEEEYESQFENKDPSTMDYYLTIER